MSVVHHLDCCTMCPLGGRWLNESGTMVGHCLLVETPSSGLVLIDTGIGTADVAAAPRRLGRVFVGVVRPGTDRARTAVEQVRALGHDPADVRHILVTHLDLDHAGGLGDFPAATVHVHAAELSTAQRPAPRERSRYRSVQWEHGPSWATYDGSGEEWFGFPAVRDLPGLDPEILVIPMPGHTRGHAAVAVKTGARWLLHCGDAYFHESAVDPTRPPPGPALRLFERSAAVDYSRVRANHERLAQLHASHRDDVTIFSAHDPAEFSRLVAASGDR